MYRTMQLIRAFEEAAGRAFHDGRIRGPVHQYVGQEAIATGVCANLRPSDYLASYHRGHGHAIAKGADINRMMRELLGREGGTCGGKGGSMHIADFSVGMLGANGVVADGATIAVGAAQAVKLLRQDRMVVAFFGDGAINRGPFLEALNWAKVFALPVLFVCEDNRWSATTATDTMTAGEGALARAQAIGVPGEEVDGNDVFAVDAAAGRLAAKVRAGEGPQFLHAITYRFRGHVSVDPAAYRDGEEVSRALQSDPLTIAAKQINGLVGARVLNEAQNEVQRALEAAANAPWPKREEAYHDVQDIG